MHVVSGDTDAVIRWCDFAVVVSGTVTLQIARQHKPMVAVYRPNKLVYHLLGRWLVSTELFTLPNLISGRRVLPELIPHFSDGEDLAVEVIKFMRRTGYADDQRAALDAVCKRFDGMQAGPNAVDVIERVLGLTGEESSPLPARNALRPPQPASV
jgi:lipid-A-disaccharide synthase